MNRITGIIFLIVWSAAAMTACSKPKSEDCKKAVDNIRAIYGTAGVDFGATPEAAIRSCRGSASRESVQCMINAKTMDDLRACEGSDMVEAEGTGGDQDGKPGSTPAEGAPADTNTDG